MAVIFSLAKVVNSDFFDAQRPNKTRLVNGQKNRRTRVTESAVVTKGALKDSGHFGGVLAESIFEYAEFPPALKARTRYRYQVFRVSPLLEKLVVFGPT